METVEEWLDVVLGDLRDTPVADAGVTLVDPARPGDFPDAAAWAVPDAPGRHRLLQVARNVTVLDDVAADPAATAVEIASYLQDFVMDALNRPWPEVVDPQGRPTVLEPRIGDAGTPEWAGRGVTCRFGGLRALLDAAGQRQS